MVNGKTKAQLVEIAEMLGVKAQASLNKDAITKAILSKTQGA